MPETRLTDYASFLQDLTGSDQDYFLEGGQAVNFWAEYFSAKGADEALAPFLPFTSKDCDVWVSYAALKYLKSEKVEGELRLGTSPADGQAGVFLLKGDVEMSVDIMTNVYGVPPAKIKHLKDRALMVGGIRVIDPFYLFQSKCRCLLGLDQKNRQDEKHLRMLCLLAREHIELLMEEAATGGLTQRALINEVKFLQEILKRSKIKAALSQIEVEPMSLIPVDALKSCGLGKVSRFSLSIF